MLNIIFESESKGNILLIFRMPRPMKGQHPKAIAARERTRAIEAAEAAQHQQEIEEDQWKDDDKATVYRKMKRKVYS